LARKEAPKNRNTKLKKKLKKQTDNNAQSDVSTHSKRGKHIKNNNSKNNSAVEIKHW